MKKKSASVGRFRWVLLSMALGMVVFVAPNAQAASNRIVGENEVAGGFGFQVGLVDWSPGGFKWFNDYSRELSERVWLNVQFNVAIGNVHDDHCWYDAARNRWRCTDAHWDGNALEFAIGPKLRFPLSNIPLVIDAKLGGAFETVFFSGDYAGVALGFRGGVGVHYYLFENFGVGVEFMTTLGAEFVRDFGTEFYGTFDVQVIGVQFRW